MRAGVRVACLFSAGLRVLRVGAPMAHLVMLTCVLGCRPSAGGLSPGVSYTGLDSMDVKKVEQNQGIVERQVEQISIELIDPPADQIVKGEKTTFTFRIKHPKNVYIATVYDVYGGRKINNEVEDLNSQTIQMTHAFTRDTSVVTFTLRNLTRCHKGGIDPQVCLGRHSIQALEPGLEFPMSTLVAIRPKESGGVQVLDPFHCGEAAWCHELVKKIADRICDSSNPKRFDFSLTAAERYSKAFEHLEFLMDAPDLNAIEGVLHVAAMVEKSTKKHNTTTKKQEEGQKGKYESCLQEYYQKMEEYASFDNRKESSDGVE